MWAREGLEETLSRVRTRTRGATSIFGDFRPAAGVSPSEGNDYYLPHPLDHEAAVSTARRTWWTRRVVVSQTRARRRGPHDAMAQWPAWLVPPAGGTTSRNRPGVSVGSADALPALPPCDPVGVSGDVDLAVSAVVVKPRATTRIAPLHDLSPGSGETWLVGRWVRWSVDRLNALDRKTARTIPALEKEASDAKRRVKRAVQRELTNQFPPLQVYLADRAFALDEARNADARRARGARAEANAAEPRPNDAKDDEARESEASGTADAETASSSAVVAILRSKHGRTDDTKRTDDKKETEGPEELPRASQVDRLLRRERRKRAGARGGGARGGGARVGGARRPRRRRPRRRWLARSHARAGRRARSRRDRRQRRSARRAGRGKAPRSRLRSRRRRGRRRRKKARKGKRPTPRGGPRRNTLFPD